MISIRYTLEDEPKNGQWTEITDLASARPFRYVRYLSPEDGWNNIAEVEFDTSPQPEHSNRATDFPSVANAAPQPFERNFQTLRIIRHFHFASLGLLLLASLAVPSHAQDVGRVSPASLPLPLPEASPMPPDRLRANNPWNLPMTGKWRFQLTHGQIVAGRYVPGVAEVTGIEASSHQDVNPPRNAFDGSLETRWCASGPDFPQWLQADLGQSRRVTGVTLTWERTTERYQCRIEGSADAKHWKTLADHSAAPGIGDGPVTLSPVSARYVRIFVTGSSADGWACLRECEIRIAEGGQETVWHPPTPKPPPATASGDSFAMPGYADGGWDQISVPSNWEMLGYSVPTYDAVDNTVGLYRRSVAVPASWAGKRIFWHFDGALDGAEVFVNGQKAGYHESGYTAFDVDLTGLVKPGQDNLFAVRVSKTTPSVDCETGDFQCMGGIYRDTSLIAVPRTHIHDLTVRTPLAANYRDATLDADVQVTGTPGEVVSLNGTLFTADGQRIQGSVSGESHVGADGTVTVPLRASVQAPKLWSAEKPNLYYLVLTLTNGGKTAERVEQRFGFKQVEVKNNIVLWNGKPIKCTGVCRHDFWADKGFALTDKEWLKDLTMIKAANINAIRTSHYNHAQRFLELCDEKGIYILDEVPYCWINDKVKDLAYAPYLLQRAQETVARDKNRPCVLAWSLGNENPNGIDSQMAMDLVLKTDPTRPAFVSGQDPESIKGQLWKDDHYPGPDSVDRYARNTKWGTNLTEHPHTFYEKEAQDYDPGISDLWSEVMVKTWDKLWKAPIILGSFIWEWQNQGIADKNPDKTRDFWYGPNHLRQENNKGIVSAYRVLKPEWWIVKMVYSPVVVGTRTVSPADGTCAVPLTNHYSFTDLSELTCRWTAYRDGTALRSGAGHIACAPMQSVTATFPAPAGMTSLRLEFDHPDGTLVSAANLAVTGAPVPAPPAAMTGGDALTTQDAADMLTVHNSLQQIAFDKQTGNIRYWRAGGHDLLVGGPILNLGEAKAGSERGFYKAPQPPVTDSANVTAQRQADGTVRVVTVSRVLTGVGGTALGTLTCNYDVRPNAEIGVQWSLDWSAPETHLWEIGLKLPLPPAYSQMRWWRDSYFTDYPDGHLGEPTGTSHAGDTLFRASKRSLHWMTLTASGDTGLALLASDTPLLARADAGRAATTLFASREAAGTRGLSGSWIADHEILATPGKPLSGAFVLRAFGK